MTISNRSGFDSALHRRLSVLRIYMVAIIFCLSRKSAHRRGQDWYRNWRTDRRRRWYYEEPPQLVVVLIFERATRDGERAELWWWCHPNFDGRTTKVTSFSGMHSCLCTDLSLSYHTWVYSDLLHSHQSLSLLLSSREWLYLSNSSSYQLGWHDTRGNGAATDQRWFQLSATEKWVAWLWWATDESWHNLIYTTTGILWQD